MNFSNVRAEDKSLGDRATQRLIGLVNSGEVTLAPIDRDEDGGYGRKLRIVKVDGESVGETLVEDGWRAGIGAGEGRGVSSKSTTMILRI